MDLRVGGRVDLHFHHADLSAEKTPPERYKELENGHPVNAAADYHLDGEPVSFDGAVEMSQMIADSDQANLCYAKHWLEFGYGRLVQDGDTPTLDELAEASHGGSVKSLILALTQTVAFRTRAPAKEVSP